VEKSPPAELRCVSDSLVRRVDLFQHVYAVADVAVASTLPHHVSHLVPFDAVDYRWWQQRVEATYVLEGGNGDVGTSVAAFAEVDDYGDVMVAQVFILSIESVR
jgi:hypothetical protein